MLCVSLNERVKLLVDMLSTQDKTSRDALKLLRFQAPTVICTEPSSKVDRSMGHASDSVQS